MTLHDKVVNIELKMKLRDLDTQITDGYTILEKVKDAGQGEGPLAKEIRNKLSVLNKQRAEIWLAANSELIQHFLANAPEAK